MGGNAGGVSVRDVQGVAAERRALLGSLSASLLPGCQVPDAVERGVQHGGVSSSRGVVRAYWARGRRRAERFGGVSRRVLFRQADGALPGWHEQCSQPWFWHDVLPRGACDVCVFRRVSSRARGLRQFGVWGRRGFGELDADVPLGHAAEQADRAGVRRARRSQTGTFVAGVLVRRESFRGGERRELHAVGVS